MSAFLIGPQTMHAVVTAILDHRRTFAGERCAAPGAGDRIGRKLYALNREALRQRYGDRFEGEPSYTFRPAAEIAPIARWKCLHCLLYQCSEGDVPDTELFRALDALDDWIAARNSFDDRSAAYTAAPWGVD